MASRKLPNMSQLNLEAAAVVSERYKTHDLLLFFFRCENTTSRPVSTTVESLGVSRQPTHIGPCIRVPMRPLLSSPMAINILSLNRLFQ